MNLSDSDTKHITTRLDQCMSILEKHLDKSLSLDDMAKRPEYMNYTILSMVKHRIEEGEEEEEEEEKK